MGEFLVLYDEPRLLVTTEKLSFFEREGHALVVEAADEVQAFIAAYDHLTRRGHMVRTIKAGENLENLRRFQEQRRIYQGEGGEKAVAVVAGLTLDQMQRVYDAGVPVVGGTGENRQMTNILNIQPYQVDTGRALVINLSS
jgi:hypothetical protein